MKTAIAHRFAASCVSTGLKLIIKPQAIEDSDRRLSSCHLSPTTWALKFRIIFNPVLTHEALCFHPLRGLKSKVYKADF
ncbi:MAG: hypothetical protein ACR2J3_12350 [Aridibacter sp.]